MPDSTERIENKLDIVNIDVRELTGAIHEQSLAIVKLCEQMHHSTEAIGRAHSRIDDVGSKVEELRDLPTRIDYLEKRVEHHGTEIETINAATAGNASRVAQREAIGATLTRFSPWLIIGAVATALAVLGAINKAFSGG